MRSRPPIIAFLPIILITAQAFAAESFKKAWPNGIRIETASGTRIPELDWQNADYAGASSVVLKGVYTRQHWTLYNVTQEKLIQTQKPGNFSMTLDLVAPSTEIELSAVGPLGEIITEKLLISIPPERLPKAAPQVAKQPLVAALPPRSKLKMSGSLGYSMISLKQTRKQDFSESALTGKITATYPIRGDIDVGLSAFGTLVPLSASIPEKASRFLGVNLRAGYAIPPIRDPWRLSLMFGYYYTTMFVPGESFGYQNQGALQFFPNLQRTFADGSQGAIYFKYSPILNGFSLLNLKNNEVAVGVSWSKALSNRYLGIAAIDVADLKLDYTDRQIETRSLSISFGIGL